MAKQGKSIFLFVGLALMMLTGCKDKSTLLVKTWKVQDLKYNTSVPPVMQESIDKWIAGMKEAFTITYNPDGSYVTRFNDQALNGKWKLNWNSSAIDVITDKGDTKTFKIAELSERKYVFKAIENGKEVIFTMVAEVKLIK